MCTIDNDNNINDNKNKLPGSAVPALSACEFDLDSGQNNIRKNDNIFTRISFLIFV